jgi:hypothetical protein
MNAAARRGFVQPEVVRRSLRQFFSEKIPNKISVLKIQGVPRLFQHPADRSSDPRFIGDYICLEWLAVRNGRVSRRYLEDWSLQRFEAVLGNVRRDHRTDGGVARRLVHEHDATRLVH